MMARHTATAVALVISMFVWLFTLVLLPPGLAAIALMGLVAAVLVAGRGVGERSIVAALTGSRPPTDAEISVLGPAMTQLSARGVNLDVLLVRRRESRLTPAVTLLGRDFTVLAPGLIDALARQRVSGGEAAALVMHAIGAERANPTDSRLGFVVFTTPWRILVGAGRRLARAFGWLPLAGTAWAARGLIGVVCVVQAFVEGPLWPGLLGGGLVALSYVVPAGWRAQLAQSEAGGDEVVVTAGLGPVLLQLLTRQRVPVSLERSQTLGNLPRPQLQLVR